MKKEKRKKVKLKKIPKNATPMFPQDSDSYITWSTWS